MNDIQTLLKNFSLQENKSFGECVKYLINQGITTQIAEMETKKFFTHSVEKVPSDILDEDIHIDIRLK